MDYTEEDNIRIQAMLDVVDAVDKMVAKLFSKMSITPLTMLEQQLVELAAEVKDNPELKKESFAKLESYIQTIGCVIRFVDDLKQNVPEAKQCWDEAEVVRNLLNEVGFNLSKIRVIRI